MSTKFDLPSLLRVFRKDIHEMFGMPKWSYRHLYEENKDVHPYEYFYEDVDDLIYENLIEFDFLTESNTTFYVSVTSQNIKGITLVLNSDKFPDEEMEIMELLGMQDISEPDEDFGTLFNWWNYDGKILNFITVTNNMIIIHLFPA